MRPIGKPAQVTVERIDKLESRINNEVAQTLKQLAGVWRLVSSEFRTVSGNVIYPLGEDALG